MERGIEKHSVIASYFNIDPPKICLRKKFEDVLCIIFSSHFLPIEV
jgi:hypothetical protein